MAMAPLLRFLTTLSFVGRLSQLITERIAPDEEVILFPTLASQINATHWNVPIHGWIYEPERDDRKRRAFLSLLRKALNLKKGDSETLCFTRRAQWFLVDNERWRSPKIEILGNLYRVPVSAKDGHFSGNAIVPIHADDETKPAFTSSEASSLEHRIRYVPMQTRARDGRIFATCAHFVPPNGGVSVISDIDDTIKISNVTYKKALLRNTFLKPFRPVPGMAQVYQEWYQQYNASFHFVSSSPYQLYTELEDFRRDSGFPPATYHLKVVRPKDKQILLKLLASPLKSKNTTIAGILDRFPRRKFVLVGDSGERDPEVYGKLAQRYVEQIAAVWIRDVSATENDEDKDDAKQKLVARMHEAFSAVPPLATRWHVFEHAGEIDIHWGLESL